MGSPARFVWIREGGCVSPVALAAAVLNELLHPRPSRQHGPLGNTVKKNSLPRAVTF